MAKTHNKKRNVGVIYEVLVRYIAECMIEKRNDEKRIASRILKRYYTQGTEVFKEYRLFKSLVETTVSTESVANSILTEAKKAAKTFDEEKLKKEKSNLIREINYQLSSDKIYNIRIDDYKLYATIQTCLNEWKQIASSDLTLLAEYENRLMNRLISTKSSPDPYFDKMKDVDNFVVKLMAEKFNERYNDSLDDAQRSLLRSYVFSNNNNNISLKMNELRSNSLSKLEGYDTSSEYVMSKVNEVKQKILEQDFNIVNDESVKRSLTLIQLMKQLESENV
jgi:ribosomal protein S17E